MDGQEIELSIQESNRLREQLGLKPLAVEDEIENNEGTYRNPRWVQDESTEEQDNLKGLDLEEELESQMDNLKWIEKSRNLERQRRTRMEGATTNKLKIKEWITFLILLWEQPKKT
ncbi:hypothetical protein Gasu2_41480 [Galdieria sulphuraria]|nr:hypothetical protein Gasu2_41480 [Galdieria sulphuraria]